jgi:hypothetical protein
MQDEDGLLEPDGLDGAIGPIRIVFNYLQHSGAPKALQDLGCVVTLVILSKMQSVSEELPHKNRKRH